MKNDHNQRSINALGIRLCLDYRRNPLYLVDERRTNGLYQGMTSFLKSNIPIRVDLCCGEFFRLIDAISVISGKDFRLAAEMLVKPLRHALDYIPLVLGFRERMSFMFVDHEFSFHTQSLQRVPELIRLWRRTLAITIAHQHQRGRLHFLDEGNR